MAETVVGPNSAIKNVDWNGNIQSRLQEGSLLPVQSGMNVTNNLANSYTMSELEVLGKLMKKLGASVNLKDSEAIRNALAINFAGVEGDFDQVVEALTNRMMPGAGDGTGKYKTTVNTSIGKYDEDVLKSLVDQSYQATVGRNATKDEKRIRLEEIQKLIDAGTKTTTTTFKGGSTTVSEPGFSQDRAQAEIAKAIKKEAPEDVETMNQIKFHDFILKNMGA